VKSRTNVPFESSKMTIFNLTPICTQPKNRPKKGDSSQNIETRNYMTISGSINAIDLEI